MDDYVEIIINTSNDELKGRLIAALTEIGFEGYEEEKSNLKAYIAVSNYNEQAFKDLMQTVDCTYKISEIKSKNWNELWESSFEPVVVNDFCAVRAKFHASSDHVKHDIIITPKMSFGTGHHATTYMMIESMQSIDFHKKKIFDFGTGTAVLAILAERMGAEFVTAIDNDDWSINNANENIAVNKSQKISLSKADKLDGFDVYDIFLANINKNVILKEMAEIIAHVTPRDGIILFSGLLASDFDDVNARANDLGLSLINIREKHNWICLHYVTTSKFA